MRRETQCSSGPLGPLSIAQTPSGSAPLLWRFDGITIRNHDRMTIGPHRTTPNMWQNLMLPQSLVGFDHRLIEFARKRGPTILRIALGIVFVWFGALKIFGVSPVAGLVAETAAFVPPLVAVVGVGIVEVVIGLGLLSGIAIRVTMLLFFLQMAATFLPVVTHPHLVFVGSNPLVLTTLGEFICKNLVLLAAGMVVVASVPKARPTSR